MNSGRNLLYLSISCHDPNEWSGRASQEVFVELAAVRSCINVFGLSLEVTCSGPSLDISARAISLADRPRTGHSGHQCSHAPGRPILHLVSSSRRPRRETGCEATSLRAPCLCSSFVRAVRPFLRPGLRLSRGAAHRGRQGWPSRLARLWRRVSRPCLDDPEHGTTLKRIGDTDRAPGTTRRRSRRSSPRFVQTFKFGLHRAVALRSSIHAAVVTIRPHRNDALSAATSIQSRSLSSSSTTPGIR